MKPEVSRRTQILPILILAIATAGLAIALGRLCGAGDFFNSYPFITDDGFDWIVQGHALNARLAGSPPATLPVLRAPGFVFVTALDARFEAQGAVIMFIFAASFFASGLVIIETARLYQCSAVVTTGAILMFLLVPVNYFRLFVLSDAVAMTLMLASTYFVLHYFRRRSARSLIGAAATALAGALTQTYAAIPFLLGVPLFLAVNRRNLQEMVRSSAAIFVLLALFLGLKALWAGAMPHLQEPQQFSLLRISADMAPFYANVWLYVFLPFGPAFIASLYAWLKRGRQFQHECIFLAVAAGVFAALTFFYQWPEARFTFFYVPLLLTLYLALSASRGEVDAAPRDPRLRRVATLGVSSSVLLVGLQLFVTPADYWRPTLHSLAWQPARSWLAALWSAAPVDRFGLGVSLPPAPTSSARVPPDLGPYKNATFQAYIEIRAHHQTGRFRPVDLPARRWDEHAWSAADAQPAGYLEAVEIAPGYARVTGWAAQQMEGAAIGIYVYCHNEFAAAAHCDRPRPDVSAVLGLPAGITPGFSFLIPTGEKPEDIEIVAVFASGQSHRLPSLASARPDGDQRDQSPD